MQAPEDDFSRVDKPSTSSLIFSPGSGGLQKEVWYSNRGLYFTSHWGKFFSEQKLQFNLQEIKLNENEMMSSSENEKTF